MSEPVRYDEVWGEWSGEPAGLAPTKGGEWVKWEDYARLQAEVERLRKAGDEVIGDYKQTGVIFPSSLYAWNAAKEGKQS